MGGDEGGEDFGREAPCLVERCHDVDVHVYHYLFGGHRFEFLNGDEAGVSMESFMGFDETLRWWPDAALSHIPG